MGAAGLMAFAARSPDSEWYYQVNDALASSDPEVVPLSFHHYLWASEFCKGKDVLEIGCKSGFGTMILSKVAAKCTGIDSNREAIKYALRNFYVEEKTKFAVGEPDSLASDFDVLISLDNSLVSAAGKRLGQLLSMLGEPRPKNRTCLFGLVNIEENAASKVVKELERVIETFGYAVDYAIYLQS
ncbi:MAG: hypothetical protein MN733_27935, partial [Nitrososphaera sp.]|nr:hypothetical protein [Nitrososphaera sp.]